MKTAAIILGLAVLGGITPAGAQTTPARRQGGAPAARPAAPAPKGGAAAPAAAPAPAAAASPVVFPHLHLQVKDVDASRKFWVDALGGTSVKTPAGEAVKFQGVLVFLRRGDPKGGSKGSVVDHVAFDVKNVKEAVARVKKASFSLVTRAETNSVYVVTDDVAFLPDQATSAAVVMAPDDMKVELIENTRLTAPVAFRHIHFAAPNLSQMKDWYVKALGAKVGNRGFGFEGLDLGRLSGALMFTLANDKVVGTAGRVDDRIGFEVRGAALLAKKLEKLGAKVTRPYGTSPDGKGMSVVLTDPWGTTLELTEGLKTL